MTNEQQQAGAGEVPEWAWKRVGELTAAESGVCAATKAFARYIAAHEPEPVDPLREVLDDCWHMMTGPRGKAIDALTAELRARGVTVAKRD